MGETNNQKPLVGESGSQGVTTPSTQNSRKPVLLLTAGKAAIQAVKPVLNTMVSSTQTAAKQVATLPQKTPRKWRWLVWTVLVLILAGLIFGVWWYFANRQPGAPKDSEVEKNVHQILYRAANFPTGTVRVSGGQIYLSLTNLDPLPASVATYNLWLAQSGDTAQRQKVIDFNADGDNLFNAEGANLGSIALPAGSSTYDRWQIGVTNVSDSSSSPAIMLEAENIVSVDTAEFYFPVDFKTVGGQLTIQKDLRERANTPDQIVAVFDPLPNLSSFGYQYEAWLVTFTGPTATEQVSLGKFQGSDSRKTITTQVPGNIDRYTTFVISLEPIGDTDNAISQIKPFSANF